MTNPMRVKQKPRTMNGNRILAKSEEKARIRSMAAPVTFGATVYKLVLTVEYPRLQAHQSESRDNSISVAV